MHQWISHQTSIGSNGRLGCSGGSKEGRSRCGPPYRPKFSQFHAVFRKICQNHRFVSPPWRVGAPSYGEYWIRPGGGKKLEIYVAAFGGHLFMTYFYRAGGSHGPLLPQPGFATGKQTKQDIFSEQIREFTPACA